MPRFALKIEYNGAPFCGWQRQKGLPSVQAALEAALGKIESGDITVSGAGRTDTGVHATGQVAHVDLAKDWTPFRLSEAVNYHLKPLPVAVISAAGVGEDFDARHSARARHYVYRLQSRRAPLVHDKGLVWRISHGLDTDAMRTAAAHLIGKHDFTTFRSTHCQAQSPVKTLSALTIEEIDLGNGTEFRFDVRARSFLHNQVRSFIGSLERVGAHSWEPDDMKTALLARDRAACGPVCPAQGLYLANVIYPESPF